MVADDIAKFSRASIRKPHLKRSEGLQPCLGVTRMAALKGYAALKGGFRIDTGL